MKKIVIAMAMMGLLTISSCGKEDNSSDKGGKEQTIPSNYYVVSPDGTTLMKWFNTEVTSIDMQSDKVLSKITKIGGENIFAECSQLTSVILPKNLETISFGAFQDCPLTSINFPNTLKNIGVAAFSGAKFTSLTIPKNVTNISEGAFDMTDLLKTVVFEGEVPPTIGRGIFATRKSISPLETIYVPAVSVDRYKNTEGLKEYADKIKAKP